MQFQLVNEALGLFIQYHGQQSSVEKLTKIKTFEAKGNFFFYVFYDSMGIQFNQKVNQNVIYFNVVAIIAIHMQDSINSNAYIIMIHMQTQIQTCFSFIIAFFSALSCIFSQCYFQFAFSRKDFTEEIYLFINYNRQFATGTKIDKILLK